MDTMAIAPEQVRAPAGHAVLFRSAPARTFAAMAAILAVAYVAVSPLVDLLLGGGDSVQSTVLQALVVGAIVAGACAVGARSSLTTWVRISDAGVEMAAQGSDPIWLAWPDIATAVVRRSGVRTVLEITPVDLESVHPVQDAGAGWPPLTETVRGTAFVADLTQVWPGPRALRRELARRMHPPAQRGR